MASKKETLVLGAGCISCAHNRDYGLYRDMYTLATDQDEDRAEKGKKFFNDLKNNPPKRTRCRFYDSKEGLLCEYFLERDTTFDESCPDYIAARFEKAQARRVSRVIAKEDEEGGNEEMREVTDDDDENEDDEPLILDEDDDEDFEDL